MTPAMLTAAPIGAFAAIQLRSLEAAVAAGEAFALGLADAATRQMRQAAETVSALNAAAEAARVGEDPGAPLEAMRRAMRIAEAETNRTVELWLGLAAQPATAMHRRADAALGELAAALRDGFAR